MRAKLSKSLLLLILSLMMSTLCFGQYPISTSILLSPPYPTNLDAYVDMLNDGVVSIENSSASTIDVYFDVSIEETNGRLKVSSKGILPNPIAVSPGMMTLSPSDIEDLFAGVGENNLETNGLSSAEQNAFLLSRQVPEGNYKICMSAFDVNGQPLNDPNVDPCAYFEVVYAERPVILFPTDKDNVEPTEFVNISWAHDVFSLKANEIEYIVKVLDLTEQKIVNIQDAMLNNGVSPEYEENVGAIKFLALQNNFDMPFEQGHKYAIRVTASDPNGSLAFQYGGHSEIVTFTYESVFEEEEEEESSFPMAELEVPESGYLNMEQDPLAFPVTWSHDFKESDTAGLLSTLTYRIKVIDMDTLKITSIDKKDFENDQYAYIWNKDVTEENFILMSDSAHTLVRGHQYAFILQVESSDDRVSFDNDGFSELVKVIIGEEPKEKKDPEEACGSTCIATLPTDQVEVPMKKNKDYTIGKLTLRTNKITKEDNGYNGSGYITLNFVKSVKVKVNFIGLKANKGMEIFSGTAQGANDEGAKLDGLVATAGSMAGLDFDAAKALAPALRNGGKLISALAGKETGLPLGIDSKVGQDEMIVGITEIMITPKRASLTALFSIENPEWGDYIPTLGATDICFSRDGFGEVVKLFLGKDYSIPMAGDHMVLKASENNAAEEKGCYAIIDCNGFKEGQITAEIGIPREILIPENEEGDIQENGMAKLTLSGTFQSSKNFILSASMSPCQIPGLEGYSFEMENGFYDASDDINPAGIIFPQGYERTATGKTWKGVWFSNVLLKAPKDWGFASEEDRTTIGIKNFIKDDVGISVVASAENILSIEKGNIEGFAISIDEISLKIIRNDFEEVKIEGKMGMPILSEGQYLPYEGIIDREEIKDKDNKTTKTTAMSFSVKPNPDGYDLDWIKSKLTFDESTEIVLKSNSKQRGVEAKLSGNLTLGGTAETLNSNRDVGMPEIDIPGIKFEGMEISKMKDLTIKTPSNSKAKDKNGGFKFVKPKFSFMGVKLALIEDATRIDIDVPDKTKETPDGDKKDPKVNGFSYNLTAMDLSFGEDGQGSASEISNGTKVSFALAGEFSLVRGKKGAAKKKNEGLAISASGGFTLESKVQIEGTKTSFKFEKFKMDSLSVDAQVSAIGIEGKVIFYNEDPTFGNGALGNINIELPILTVAIDARFGSKEDYNYWYLFGNVIGGSAQKPIPLATFQNIVSIYGFNGGAYYHMTDKGGLDPATRYVPNKSTLLGLEAGLTIAVTRPEVIWGNVTLGAEFQTGGIGLSMLKLRGDVYILKGDMKQRGANDEVQGIEGRLDAKLNLKDPENISFTADMKIFVNVAEGAVVGNMAGGKPYQMVQANLNIYKKNWYMHMGTPEKRASLKLGIPGMKVGVTAQAYLMLGNTTMPQAQMPKRIQNLLGKSNKDFSGGTSSIRNTRNNGGFVMGASLEYELDIEASILYANFYAGFGFDLSLIDFEGVVCSNNGNKPLGMDGWYAQGQVYAGLSGDIGLDIDIAIYEGRISLANLSAVMALKGGFPNPIYATGRARMSYSVLGGIIEGSTSFGVDLGKRCIPDIVDPFAGISFIASMSPPEGKTTKGVSPFIQPKMSLNQRLGRYTFYTPTASGGRKKHYFEVQIEEFIVLDQYNRKVNTGSYKKLSDLEYAWSSTEYLKPYSTYKAKVKLKCKKWDGTKWIVAKRKNGTPWTESKSTTFRTGALPNKITLNNVKITYPFINERNYMHGNNYFKTGLIKLTSQVDYLWKRTSKSTDEWRDEIKVKFYDKNTYNLVSTQVFRDLKGDVIEYYMPKSLEKNKVYRIDIVRTYTKNPYYRNTQSSVNDITRRNYYTGSNYTIKRDGKTYSSYNSKQPKDVVLFRYYFGTSKYNNIREKLQPNKTHKLSWVSGRSYDWRQITYDFKASEGFGKAELSSQNIEASNTKNDGKLIFKENRNNSYYNYMLDDYCTNMRDLVRHFKVIKDGIYHLPDYWWGPMRKKHPTMSWKALESWGKITGVSNYYSQGFYPMFSNMYKATGSHIDPREYIVKTSPSIRSLVSKNTSKSYLWGSQTRALTNGEIKTNKYDGRYDGSKLHSILPGYLYIGGEIRTFMWSSLQLEKELLIKDHALGGKIRKLYNNRERWDPKNSYWRNTTFSVRATYRNPENPNRSGKHSYSYGYTINFRQ